MWIEQDGILYNLASAKEIRQGDGHLVVDWGFGTRMKWRIDYEEAKALFSEESDVVAPED